MTGSGKSSGPCDDAAAGVLVVLVLRLLFLVEEVEEGAVAACRMLLHTLLASTW